MVHLKSKIVKEYQEWQGVFWACCALNILAYLGYIVHFTYAVDDYGLIFTKANHIAHGRWFAGFIYNILLQKSFMPSLAPIIAMTCYILTGIGFCKLWNTSKKTSLLVIALWSLHPYLLDAYTFRISTILFSVVYLIAVTSLSLVSKGKRGFAVAVVLFYLTLSSYQVTLGFAVSVVMVQVLLTSYRDDFSKDSIRKAIHLLSSYGFMLVLSVAGYLVITKLLFFILDVEVNPRFQQGVISDLGHLKIKAGFVMVVLFARLMPLKEFVLPFMGKLVMFVVTLGAIVTVMKRPSKISRRLLVILWLIFIPLGAVLFTLPLESLSLPWRTCMGLVVFFVGMLALTQESNLLLIRRTGITCACFLIVYFILNNNTIIYKHHLTNQKDFIMGTRIISKIQSLEDYQPDMELAVLGRVPKHEFSIEGKGLLEILHGYIKHCSVQRYSITRSAFQADYSKYAFLLKYLNLELKECSPDSLERARVALKDKLPWPDPSSVFIHDDIVVVVLSSPTGELYDFK